MPPPAVLCRKTKFILLHVDMSLKWLRLIVKAPKRRLAKQKKFIRNSIILAMRWLLVLIVVTALPLALAACSSDSTLKAVSAAATKFGFDISASTIATTIVSNVLERLVPSFYHLPFFR